MLQRETDKRWLIQFGSLFELTRWLETTPESPRWARDRSSHNTGYSYGQRWDLGHGYDGCLKLAQTGWADGVQQLHALSAAIPNESRMELSYSVAGDYADVPRAVSGDPFSMVRRGKVRQPHPIMTIAVNTRISAAVGAQEAANYGAALVALVDRLETNGVRVELIGLLGTDLTGKRFCASWTIKHAEDPLDLSAVAFSLAHPGMFRRLGFALMERTPNAMHHWGYGIEGGISADDFLDLPEGALLISGVNHNPGACRTMEGALKFAKDSINAAAKKLGHEPIAELEAYE